MKERTVKLSGHGKDRFLERFFADEPGLDAPTRQRLVERSKAALSSVRVRKAAIARKHVAVKPLAPAASLQTEAQPKAAPPAPAAPSTPAPPPAPAADAAPASFDPYAFGLVPIFQREGAEGLAAKLASVKEVAHLRQMAKAQQIVLPQELRAGEASADANRAGIVEAVAKRIKDRRAAAG
jgi:hypothetical protein